MPIIKSLFSILVFLLAATGAHATTNPLGAGWPFANGTLFLPANSPLQALTLPFSYSYNFQANTVPSADVNLITSSPNTAGAGFISGFFQSPSNDSYHFKNYFPNSFNTNGKFCNQQTCMIYRWPQLADGRRHNVCMIWQPNGTGQLYIDGLQKDNDLVPGATYVPSPDLNWDIGLNASSDMIMWDMRVYTRALAVADCVSLANSALNGVYPTSGPLDSGMAVHLPLDNCTLTSSVWSCNDTSGNGNVASTVTASPGTVAILTPMAGTVSGNVALTASCTQIGSSCTKVCYYVDNILISGTCPGTAGSFLFSWDSTKIIDGTHTLSAIGYNAAGFSATSPTVTVTTFNSIAAKNYYFDPAGDDSHTCLSILQACATFAKFASGTYLGGDTVHFLNTGTFPTTAVGKICGASAVSPLACTQNYYASSSGPLTITTYGTGTCNPFTAILPTASTGNIAPTLPANCAHIQRTGGGNGDMFELINASNVTIENLAITGGTGSVTNCGATSFANNAVGNFTTIKSANGQSDSVIVQNNFMFGWACSVVSNYFYAFVTFSRTGVGPITNYQVLDNVISGQFGLNSSADAGIFMGAATQALIQGNLITNQGGANNDQGSGIETQNWPNPGGVATPTIIQFNVSHETGGTYGPGQGGPYAFLSFTSEFTTWQFNEQYTQRCWTGLATPRFPACMSSYGGVDDGGFDADGGTQTTTVQYNYFHDNPMTTTATTGGSFTANAPAILFAMLNGGPAPGGAPSWGPVYVRYNIMENNAQGMLPFAGPPNNGFPAFYNNTISSNLTRNDGSTSPNNGPGTCWGIYAPAGTVNNICIRTANAGVAYFSALGTGGGCPAAIQSNKLDYNDYFSIGTATFGWWVQGQPIFRTFAGWQAVCDTSGPGFTHWVHDTHSLNVDPKITGTASSWGTCYNDTSGVAPAGPAHCTPSPYILQAGSPLIGTGVDFFATFAAPTNPTVDFFGNAVPNGVGSGWNIGADGGHH